MQAGIFNNSQQKSKPAESGTKEKKLDDGTTVFIPANYVPPQPSLKERAKPLVERFKAQQKAEREADLTNEDDDEITPAIMTDTSFFMGAKVQMLPNALQTDNLSRTQ